MTISVKKMHILPPCVLNDADEGVPLGFCKDGGAQKNRMVQLTEGGKFDKMYLCLGKIPHHDGQTETVKHYSSLHVMHEKMAEIFCHKEENC